MFWQDVPMIFLWWATWVLFGFVGWTWIKKIFAAWIDQGYLFAKIFGVLLISFLVWIFGMLRIVPFGVGSILISVFIVAGLGIYWDKKHPVSQRPNLKVIGLEELLFLILLLFWSFIKGHQPDISGLEKFMDFGFMQSILHSRYFPPADMWFAGKSINYYYFGHLYVAVLTKISGINLAYTFNLILATLFALTGTMGGAITYHLLAHFKFPLRLFGTLLASYILLFGGNLHTIYSFTKGYSGDNPPPFWQIWGRDPDTPTNYWYPDATRFIPYTIHEFPSYSFVVSDIHGHVLDLPIVLLLIALLINFFTSYRQVTHNQLTLSLIGFTAGAAFMTNALDALVYLGLFSMLCFLSKIPWKKLLPTFIIFALTILPFVLTFKSFVNGVAVDCPPKALENTRFGPLVFEEVTKCQKSPLWMMLILWGFFVYGGVWLYAQKKSRTALETGMLWVSLYCLGLIIFPEFFYFRDIYPLHFRSNTMFKLGYQVFIMMTFVTVYALIKGFTRYRQQLLGILGLAPLLYLVVIYPKFSIPGYFGEVKWASYQTLNGVAWIARDYPDNYAVLNWFAKNIPPGQQPVILEANGDSYTNYNMYSAFGGLPTVAGWVVHEWLWREGYGPIAARAEEVRQFYEDSNLENAKLFLTKYQVKYIIIGNFEIEKYKNLNLPKIKSLASPVFTSGDVTIYKVN